MSDVVEMRNIPSSSYGTYIDAGRYQNQKKEPKQPRLGVGGRRVGDLRRKGRQEDNDKDGNINGDDDVDDDDDDDFVVSVRELSQAMVPGKHLIKMEVLRSTWESGGGK